MHEEDEDCLQNAGKFLSSCTTGFFSRRAQLHDVSYLNVTQILLSVELCGLQQSTWSRHYISLWGLLIHTEIRSVSSLMVNLLTGLDLIVIRADWTWTSVSEEMITSLLWVGVRITLPRSWIYFIVVASTTRHRVACISARAAVSWLSYNSSRQRTSCLYQPFCTIAAPISRLNASGIVRLRFYLSNFLDRLKKLAEQLGAVGCGADSNSRSPENDSRMFTTQPRCSVVSYEQ
jgi:hypothetical protein